LSANFSISLGEDEWAVIGIVLLNQEGSWLVLLILQRNDLGQVRWVLSLGEVNFVSINNDVLSEILISVESSLMRDRWLINRPVVEWRVHDWVHSMGLN